MNRNEFETMDVNCEEELLALEAVPVNTKRIKQKVFARLVIDSGETIKTAKGNMILFPEAKVRGKKIHRKALRILAVAAMLVVLTSVAVYAAANIYLSMTKQEVGYFTPEASADTPVNSSVYHPEIAEDLSQFNAAVGQSIPFEGKTVTLDSVSVDDNFLNYFFTIAFDEAIDLNEYEDDTPAYSKLQGFLPRIFTTVDGEYLLSTSYQTMDAYDPYMTDEKTIQLMVREAIPNDLPDVLELGVYLAYEQRDFDYLNPDTSDKKIKLTLDKSAAKPYTRYGEPGLYTLQTKDGEKNLEITKLSVSPFGMLMTTKLYYEDETGNPLSTEEKEKILKADDRGDLQLRWRKAYPRINQFYITDDRGNVVNPYSPAWTTLDYDTNELIGAAADATSLTFTPIVNQPEGSPRQESQDIYVPITQVGAKLPITNLGGYTIESYSINGSKVSVKLKPYGKVDYYGSGGIVWEDYDSVPVKNGNHTGLLQEQIDRKTGILTFSLNYYTATQEQLEQATIALRVNTGNIGELDEAAAITIPLTQAESNS